MKVVTLPQTDGTNNSINRFYGFCNERDTLYIKMDDDLVFLPPDFGRMMLDAATAGRGQKLWWSPVVVNNAICTWLLKYFSQVKIPANVTAQAGCPIAWRSPAFAESLHRAFISALRDGTTDAFRVPDTDVMSSRFSINCVAYFGDDVVDAGADFCPVGVDDEEWLSAVLPARLGRPGQVVGTCVVAHFGFFTQEASLLKTTVLDEYYNIAGLKLTHRPVRKVKARSKLKAALLERLATPPFPHVVHV